MNEPTQLKIVIESALFRVLKSIARVAIRYGVSAGAVNELVRRAFVEAAGETLVGQGDKPRTSRICTLTGLYRKEVVRVLELPPVGEQVTDDRYNRSARVVTGWSQDHEFCTSKGQPAALALSGDGGFSALVKRYSGDMTPRSVLEELKRLGIVEVTARQRVKLLSRAYVPAVSELDTLQILGTDVSDLVNTIDHNLNPAEDERLFQRKVAYVHLPYRHIEAFRRYSAAESQKLLEKLDRWLARHDTENKIHGTHGARLGLGIYQFEEEHPAVNTTLSASVKENTND